MDLPRDGRLARGTRACAWPPLGATLTCHKAVLAEPPPPKSVDIARKMQEQKEAQERDFSYRISRENAFQSTQKFSALKDLLGGL
eukprot:g33116.t1